jgi:hypothetical protein
MSSSSRLCVDDPPVRRHVIEVHVRVVSAGIGPATASGIERLAQVA